MGGSGGDRNTSIQPKRTEHAQWSHSAVRKMETAQHNCVFVAGLVCGDLCFFTDQ